MEGTGLSLTRAQLLATLDALRDTLAYVSLFQYPTNSKDRPPVTISPLLSNQSMFLRWQLRVGPSCNFDMQLLMFMYQYKQQVPCRESEPFSFCPKMVQSKEKKVNLTSTNTCRKDDLANQCMKIV